MFLQQVDTEEDYSISGSSGAEQNDTRPEKAGSVHSLNTRERETLSPVMIGLKKHRRNLSNLTTGKFLFRHIQSFLFFYHGISIFDRFRAKWFS